MQPLGKVFVSHASADKPFVDRLVADLARRGIPVWYDKLDLKVGQSIPAAIGSGLADAKYFAIVLSKASVASKWLLGRYTYDVWGQQTLATGADVTDNGFTGHQRQGIGELVLAQYRAYDPALARWLSEDPSGLVDGPNEYAYAGGSPIVWSDPDGLQKRMCPPRVYLVLRAAVVASCKVPTACYQTDSCTRIKLKIATKRLCIVAQRTLTKRCYPHNPSHEQRYEDEERGIKTCQDILAQKERNCECK